MEVLEAKVPWPEYLDTAGSYGTTLKVNIMGPYLEIGAVQI